jgi:hypothetical protein
VDIELKWWKVKKDSRSKEKRVREAVRAQEEKESLLEAYRRAALGNGTAVRGWGRRIDF